MRRVLIGMWVCVGLAGLGSAGVAAETPGPEVLSSGIGPAEVEGRRYLDYLVRLAGASNVQAQQTIRQGTPYREIADLAREEKVDLIVIGRVGCRGARCALVGSVAERVIEYAHCPVLVVSQPPTR